jgi:hypothetical protein
MQIADWGSPNVEAGAARGHYREPKPINPEKGMESAWRAAHGHGGGSEPPKCGTRSVRRRSTEANAPSLVAYPFVKGWAGTA